jgi:membrane peptidoglycan carboxypeptidase
VVALWVATLRIPDLQSFQQKILTGSTKIYDKTGEIVLFDLNQNVKQQVVPFDQISDNIKKATIAIEDEDFIITKALNLTPSFEQFLLT